MESNTARLLRMPLDEIPEFLLRAATVDSPANRELMQGLMVRITIEGTRAANDASVRMTGATEGLTAELKKAAVASEKAGGQLLKLNVRLYWITFAMFLLTLVLVLFGAFQLYLMINPPATSVQHQMVEQTK